MYKVDLHTHSIASPDGSITAQQYEEVLNNGQLDCVAVTDHNRIDFAQSLQEKLGPDKVIVGEEIMTLDGEVIGLFLTRRVEPNRSLESTIKDIKAQDAIVYIPHPFETVRSGVSRISLDRIRDQIDIVESANGRAYFQNRGPEAHTWARVQSVPVLASSDAHHAKALGKTYSILNEIPDKQQLISLARTARKIYTRPTLADMLAPKLNRFKKLIQRP